MAIISLLICDPVDGESELGTLAGPPAPSTAPPEAAMGETLPPVPRFPQPLSGWAERLANLLLGLALLPIVVVGETVGADELQLMPMTVLVLVRVGEGMTAFCKGTSPY